MKSIYLIQLVLFLAVLIIMEGCQSSPEREYDILTIEGVEWASNISNSYLNFGSLPTTEEDLELKLVVSPGDMIYIGEFYLKYKKRDTLHQRVSDQDKGYFINDKQVEFYFSNDESWSEFDKMSPEEISYLGLVLIDKPLSDEQLSILEKYQDSYNDIGLVHEASERTEEFHSLLSILKPSWLMTDSLIIDESSSENFKSLELLWLVFDETSLRSIGLKYCPNLQQLIITEWAPDSGEHLNLSAMKNLNSLTFGYCELTDLSNFEFPPSLTRLHFIECDLPAEISELMNIRKLKSLSLAGCDVTIDSAFRTKLSNLQYLALPAEISQEDFNQLIQKQSSLEVLEIHGSDSISDLSILTDLTQLKALTIDLPDIDFTQLYDLNDLELLILNSDIFDDDSVQIEKLKAALPETNIYPGGGFCLGSGWLLLMIPFILLMRYAINTTQKLRYRRNG